MAHQINITTATSGNRFYRIAGLHQLIVNGKIRVEQIAMMREERPQDGQDRFVTRSPSTAVQTPTLPGAVIHQSAGLHFPGARYE